MANEIIGTAQVLANGRQDATMLYYFPIVPRVKDAQNADVVPAFDPALIPQTLKSQMSGAQLAAIAAGDAGYLITTLTKSAGETDSTFVTRTKPDYDALCAYALQQRRDQAVEANNFNQRRFVVTR